MSDRDRHNSDKLTSLLLFGILFFKVGSVLRRCRSLQSFAFDSSFSSGQLLKLSHEGVRVGPGSAERRITLARAIARANDILNMLGYQIHRHCVIGTSRNDHVSVFFSRKTELFESGLDEASVLIQNVLQGSVSLLQISKNPSREPRVGICIDEQLHIEQIADFLVVEDENPLDDDDVGGIHGGPLVGDPRVGLEVVDRDPGRSALHDVLEAGDQHLMVESVGVVKVEESLLGLDALFGVEVSVEGVLRDGDDLFVGGADVLAYHGLDDLIANGRLSGSGSASDADQERFSPIAERRSPERRVGRGLASVGGWRDHPVVVCPLFGTDF